MTFEEEFPSLKASPIEWYVDTDKNVHYTDSGTKEEFDGPIECFSKKDILKHCKDNQRIIEAIDKAFEKYAPMPVKNNVVDIAYVVILKKQILKELSLVD